MFEPQLYDLSKDIGEQNNVIDKYPDIANELQAMLDKIKVGEE